MYTQPCFWMKCFGVLNGVISRTVVPPKKDFIRKNRAFGDPAIAVTHVLISVSAETALPTVTVECELLASFLKSSSLFGHEILSPLTRSPIKEHHSSCFLLSFRRWIKPSLLHHHPWQRNMFLFLPFWNKTKQLAIDSTSLASYHSFFQSP